MMVKYLVPAVALVSSAAAASSSSSDSASASACSSATATINSAADATALSSCSTYKGSILISPDAAPSISITGVKEITGDLILKNNGAITGFSSDSIETITGSWTMSNVTALANLQFTALKKVGDISWTSLNALDSLNFGDSGVSSAKSVVISDTFLSSLDGIDVETVDTININNNGRLTEWNSKLSNLSDLLNIQANGQDFTVSLPDLTWIANMTIANVSKFSVPALQVVNGSARFDSNYFTSFAAPNLTSTTSGDISFVDNGYIGNISFPSLTTVGGGLLIANNTQLGEIAFPKLKSVYGAIKLRGNFTEIEFPALSDVRGAFDAASTTNMDDSCTTLKKLSGDGGNGDVQGTFNCKSNNTKANEDTGTNTSSTSSGGSSSSSSDDKGSAAAGIAFNAGALALTVVGAMVALL